MCCVGQIVHTRVVVILRLMIDLVPLSVQEVNEVRALCSVEILDEVSWLLGLLHVDELVIDSWVGDTPADLADDRLSS